MISLLKNYIDNLNIQDVKNFFDKNDISLDNKELDILYKHLKNDWYTFIYEDERPILKDIEANIDKENYSKLYSLYIKYKNKYINYL